MAEPEGKQRKKELTTSAQLIEKAIAIHDTPDKYSLLGAIHTDLGNWNEARAAYTKASTSDDGAISTEARKNYEQFLELRSDADIPDPLAVDARKRIGL